VASGRLVRADVSKRDRGGKEKGARAVLKPKYIRRLTDEYTWAMPRGPCCIYLLVTDEYTRQIRRLTDEYTWQGHVSMTHDMFIG
jgi:hypothetical protein